MGRPKRQKGRKRPPKWIPNQPQNDQKTTPKSTKFRDDLFEPIRRIGLGTRGIGGSSLGRPPPLGRAPRAFKKSKKILKYYNTTILQRKYKGPRDQGTKGPKDQGTKGPKGPKDQKDQGIQGTTVAYLTRPGPMA